VLGLETHDPMIRKLVCYPLHHSALNFQLNSRIFCIEQHCGTNVSKGRRQGSWTIKGGGLEPEVDKKITFISAYTHDGNNGYTYIFDFKQHDWTALKF